VTKEPNCDCRGLTKAPGDKNAGDDCGKHGYSFDWCYTTDNECGPGGNRHWKKCEITQSAELLQSNNMQGGSQWKSNQQTVQQQIKLRGTEITLPADNVNDGRTQFVITRGTCGFGMIGANDKGTAMCIQPDFEECLTGQLRKSGECDSGVGKPKAYCCPSGRFRSCGIDNINCGYTTRFGPPKECSWYGNCNRRRRRLMAFLRHKVRTLALRSKGSLENKMSRSDIVCNGQPVEGNNNVKIAKIATTNVLKYLTNYVEKIVSAFGLTNADLQQANRLSASDALLSPRQSLYSIGMRVDANKNRIVFDCCQSEVNMCTIAEDVHSGGDEVRFMKDDMNLRIYKSNDLVAFDVTDTKGFKRRRRLLNARTGRS
jgi:hypothetical protein